MLYSVVMEIRCKPGAGICRIGVRTSRGKGLSLHGGPYERKAELAGPPQRVPDGF